MKRLQSRVRHGRRQQHIHLPPSGYTELINGPDPETAGRDYGDQAAEGRTMPPKPTEIKFIS
ncbi:hypothetical protein I9H06_10905 [Pseudomonas tremae]|uniref:hypothetical protein n=1 Tax=Pseudomonas tremae TaxID=200454 RepID=UPI001F3BCE36|nr:hypothetical protein [Pseudomonas tremae]MCF5715470.1 hypothetical protein [Pseudomonas tremae]UQB33702.1 hypothetical protein I9H06_10905 [Pseudomonas tremae]